MSIQDLGSIGELVAAIATIITLLYLALQIRQSTVTQRSSIVQEWVRVAQLNNHLLINSDELWEILNLARKGLNALEPTQRGKFRTFMTNFFNGQEAIFLQHRMRVVDQAYYESRMLQVKELLRDSTGTREFWRTYSPSLYTTEFIEEIERLAEIWQIDLLK